MLYILRIPYSIINELHSKDFEAILQPGNEKQINETVDAVGFDFIRPPKVECDYFIRKSKNNNPSIAVIKINTFKSVAMVKGANRKSNLETLSMVLIDYDYPFDPTRQGNTPTPPLEFDLVYYANDIEKEGWEIPIPSNQIGDYMLVVYIDIYGNEYTELKTISDFRVSK